MTDATDDDCFQGPFLEELPGFDLGIEPRQAGAFVARRASPNGIVSLPTPKSQDIEALSRDHGLRRSLHRPGCRVGCCADASGPELALCGRYFEKSYDQATPPGFSTGGTTTPSSPGQVALFTTGLPSGTYTSAPCDVQSCETCGSDRDTLLAERFDFQMHWTASAELQACGHWRLDIPFPEPRPFFCAKPARVDSAHGPALCRKTKISKRSAPMPS